MLWCGIMFAHAITLCHDDNIRVVSVSLGVVSSSIWPGSRPVAEAGFGLRGAMAKSVCCGEKSGQANDLATLRAL